MTQGVKQPVINALTIEGSVPNLRLILIVLASVLLFAKDAAACSCPPIENILEWQQKADYVFVGDLKSKNPFRSFSSSKYKFAILQLVKGAETLKVEVWGPKFGPSCAIDIDRDSSYVVMAYLQDGKLWVESCSTWPMNEDYKSRSEMFRSANKLD